MSPKDLALAGPMGAGKTSSGRRIALWLDAAFTDLDGLIENREGSTIPALFAQGEPVFRAAEARAVEAWLAGGEGDPRTRVLALGGGTLENPILGTALERHAVVVHLDASGTELAARLNEEARAARPLISREADPSALLDDLRNQRKRGYQRAAFTIDTSGQSVRETAVAVLRRLYHPESGPWKTEPCALAPGITTGRGGLPFPEEPVAALLWDNNLPRPHADVLLPLFRRRARDHLVLLHRTGGEDAKTPASLCTGWEELAAGGLPRGAALWVAGGGTLTDLAGLLGHTFKRGLILRLLPTTLVAQLDASLGGKNALNLGPAKNLIGTIRLPAAVHLDSLFLLTLGNRDLRAGLAEAVKCALIGDPELLDRLAEGPGEPEDRGIPFWEEITNRSAKVKLDLVARDLYEADERRLLNLGHTLGHALEWAMRTRTDPPTHGEAVAAGTAFALRLALRLGVLADPDLEPRVTHVLEKWDLPTRLPRLTGVETENLYRALAQDKKRSQGQNVWVLPRRAGQCLLQAVDEATVLRELADLGH